jgi:hypothetical protein
MSYNAGSAMRPRPPPAGPSHPNRPPGYMRGLPEVHGTAELGYRPDRAGVCRRPSGSARWRHEEDPMAITERDRILYSTHRHAAPNADYLQFAALRCQRQVEHRSAKSGRPSPWGHSRSSRARGGHVLLFLSLALKGPAGLAEALPPQTMRGHESALASWRTAGDRVLGCSISSCYLARGFRTSSREMRVLLHLFTGGRSARPGTPRHCLPSRAGRSRGCAAR